ncbi:MAG: hypothetical protein M5U28_42560 [Sandaracinaceae bacterium]|nr:hypothetical protein [Sandaracinaceae bacterium]
MCGDLDLDGCLEWSPPAPCGEGESCMAGLCAEGCEDECSEAACAGDRFSQCGQFDRDACLDLSPGVDCRLPGTCEVGACTPSGCTAAPVVCDAPPASTCVDADTLRAFDPIGTCSDGVCSYEASEVACPDGCADGACAGDPCAGVTCDAPPSAECFDASTRRTYAPTGTCAGGTCTYAPTDTPCPHGCALGECSPDLCADVRCESPPFATCVGASTRRTYASTGTCLSGVCSYAATDTPCAEGCAAGTCTCTRSWTTVTVEAPDATGFFPSLALDASGAVHISHGRGGFSDNLGYARRDPTSGTWTLDTADPLGAIPHWTSLAVHPSGAVHISYHHWVTKELRYARRDPASGTWTAVTVDTMGEAGVFSSLAVDGAGAVHIGYHEDLDGDLRYARRDPASGTWSTMVVDAAGDTGSSTSLAVDRSGGGSHQLPRRHEPGSPLRLPGPVARNVDLRGRRRRGGGRVAHVAGGRLRGRDPHQLLRHHEPGSPLRVPRSIQRHLEPLYRRLGRGHRPADLAGGRRLGRGPHQLPRLRQRPPALRPPRPGDPHLEHGHRVRRRRLGLLDRRGPGRGRPHRLHPLRRRDGRGPHVRAPRGVPVTGVVDPPAQPGRCSGAVGSTPRSSAIQPCPFYASRS